MTRKIIQISAAPDGPKATVAALASDGTVWVSRFNLSTSGYGPWDRLPNLPETDAEAIEESNKLKRIQSPLTKADRNRKYIMEARRNRLSHLCSHGLHSNPTWLALNGTDEECADYVRRLKRRELIVAPMLIAVLIALGFKFLA